MNISNAQKIKLYYDLKKDRVWVERQKAIVEKGFELHPYKKDNYLKQLKYVNSCVNLGRYFETMFDMRRISTMKKSVYFYEKVADFGRFPDDEKYFKALAIRNSVLRKLADIYFVGKGIKKDKKLSLELALAGSSGYDGFFTYYSKRYFNCNCIILKKKVVDDGYFYIIGNPFAMQANLLNVKTIDKFLIEIGNKFMAKKKLDSSLVLNIIAYP
ncbi:MAG: hypothetical protein KA319_09885, partial [Ferruginibacter sp.]|nr:hypothetical protein [Ferruginibacter sp.]